MNERSFVERREPEWRRLGEYCTKADSRIADLSPEEFRDFLGLYRRVSRDLTVARTQSDNVGLIDYLNDLVGRGYGILYRSPAKPLGRTILDAIEEAARTFRRRFAFVGASAAIFAGSILFAFFTLTLVPESREEFMPQGMEKNFEGWKKGRFEERDGSVGALMTGFYASNNPRVAVIAGAVGAGTFGLLSIYLVYSNGALLGTLAHEMAGVGQVGFLAASVSPHGVPELSGIIVSGAVGILLGWAVLFPGRRSRAESLRFAGKDAMTLLATSVVLMFIAAPIEGFFSFDPHVSTTTKAIVAGLEVIAWASFWTFFGREIKWAARERGYKEDLEAPGHKDPSRESLVVARP